MSSVIVSKEIEDKIGEIIAHYDFIKEIGGILIGAYDKKKSCLKITDMSFPYSSDLQMRFRFSRKSDGHQEFMDNVWQQSGQTKAYIGEWHTHDQDKPSPSAVDCKTWKRISAQDNNFKDCFYIIIGRSEYKIWGIQNGEVIEQKGLKDE